MPRLCLRLATTSVLIAAAACNRTPGPPSAVDSAMAECVPASTTLLAGIDLGRLRSSPLYAKLPASATALLEPLREAQFLLLASDGHNLLTIARGPFHQPPAGAEPLAKDLVISGTPDFVAAAKAQYKAGSPGARNLLAYVSTVAPGVQIWIVARGGVALPLPGNAANLNRLLRDCENAAIMVKVDSLVSLSFTALGRTSDAAHKVEDTLRATITLAAAGEGHRPDILALLHAIRLTRDDRIVRATVEATPEATGKLLSVLTP
jgi:hypothetical protein